MDQEQAEVSEWTVEQAMKRFDASQPAKTRKRPRDLNKLAASIVGDATDDDTLTLPPLKYTDASHITFHGKVSAYQIGQRRGLVSIQTQLY